MPTQRTNFEAIKKSAEAKIINAFVDFIEDKISNETLTRKIHDIITPLENYIQQLETENSNLKLELQKQRGDNYSI